MERKTWDEYFFGIADEVSKRSTCIRRQVGAVVIYNKRILATGYNGVPSGLDHCTNETCIRNKLNIPSGERHELCMAVHAEQNAIAQAAYHGGLSLNGSTMYVNTKPCFICAKLIINSGISCVCYSGDYPDSMTKDIFYKAGIRLKRIITNEEEKKNKSK